MAGDLEERLRLCQLEGHDQEQLPKMKKNRLFESNLMRISNYKGKYQVFKLDTSVSPLEEKMR
jgi:hypothetical protein